MKKRVFEFMAVGYRLSSGCWKVGLMGLRWLLKVASAPRGPGSGTLQGNLVQSLPRPLKAKTQPTAQQAMQHFRAYLVFQRQ